MTIETSSSNGIFHISLILHSTEGRGLCGYLSGGLSHVGGVAYAVPRPRSDGKGITADISTICGPGHKDVYAAQEVAKQICLQTGETVCICAGIHMERASKNDIALLMDLCLEAADRAVETYIGQKKEKSI